MTSESTMSDNESDNPLKIDEEEIDPRPWADRTFDGKSTSDTYDFLCNVTLPTFCEPALTSESDLKMASPKI